MKPAKELRFDQLTVKIFPTRDEMGMASAKHAGEIIREAIARNGRANIVFAAAPSQNEFLRHLMLEDIDWGRVCALHMDEYIGLPLDAPQRFGNFLKEAIFSKVPFGQVFYLNQHNGTPEAACREYTEILHENPPDLICVGIGENGHLAFNDPPTADFCDPEVVKTVKLDEVCRNQQVNDGCFATIDEVPTHAITLSMSALLSSPKIIGIVPGRQKAVAVKTTATGPISTDCPATALRNLAGTVLYADSDAASLL